MTFVSSLSIDMLFIYSILIANSQFLSLSMHFLLHHSYLSFHGYKSSLISFYLIRNFGGLSSVYSIVYIFLSYVCFSFCLLCYGLYKYPVKHNKKRQVLFQLTMIESDSNELTADQEMGF